MDDKELKKEKKIGKIGRNAAVSIGLGLGFLVLTPSLPDIDNEAKTDAMKGLFANLAIMMISYGAVLLLSVVFVRNKAQLIAGIMSWFVAPSLALWFCMEVMDVLAME